MIDTVGIDNSAVSENQPHLRFEHGMIEKSGDIVQFAVFAELTHQASGRDSFLLEKAPDNLLGFILIDIRVADPRFAGKLHIHERFEIARTDTSDLHEIGIDSQFLQNVLRSLPGFHRAGGTTAGAGPEENNWLPVILESLPGFFSGGPSFIQIRRTHPSPA